MKNVRNDSRQLSENYRARGFTLIELVVVIVLLGITAVTLTLIFTRTVSGYLDTSNRQDSAAIMRMALDRIGRELREAMPMSVRISNNCLQFLPVIASTVYIDLTANSTSISVLDFPIPVGSGYFAAVYPIQASDLYGLFAMESVTSITNGSSPGIRTLTLATAFATPFPYQSPSQRLYIVGNPISFCIESNGQLNRYQSVVTSIQPSPGAGLIGGSILINNLVPLSSSFSYNGGTWQNNALVTIKLSVQQSTSNNELLQLDHEVWLRNVQ